MKKIIISILILFLSANIFANEEIKKILGKYTNSNVEIDFELKTYWEIREKETKVKGKIVLAPENRFNISMGKMNFVSDGKTLWEYNSRQKQVKIQKNAPNVFDFLNADLNSEGVEVKLSGDDVEKITITDKDNNITTYTFEKVVFLPKVDENLFNFVIPSGAQVYEY